MDLIAKRAALLNVTAKQDFIAQRRQMLKWLVPLVTTVLLAQLRALHVHPPTFVRILASWCRVVQVATVLAALYWNSRALLPFSAPAPVQRLRVRVAPTVLLAA